jgi:predicted metal-binding membrane protein
MRPAASEKRPLILLKSALRENRSSALVLLVLVPLVSWLWIIVMARDMYGPMTGASAWMMRTSWDAQQVVLLWAMWAVMMTGMMLPSAAPLLMLYAAIARRSSPANASRRIYALAAGYLAAWTLFSLGATALQRVLSEFLIISAMMEITSPIAGGIVLLVAGVFQWTPLKRVCLRTCQSPLGFLMSRWRDNASGAFIMGFRHGAYCVGCCWALMLLLFAGGVMNLTVIAALTLFVAFEKLAPFGVHGARVSGAILITLGLWMIFR